MSGCARALGPSDSAGSGGDLRGSLCRGQAHRRRFSWMPLAAALSLFGTRLSLSSPGRMGFLRRLLHHFYDPFPEVGHYRAMQVVDGGVMRPRTLCPAAIDIPIVFPAGDPRPGDLAARKITGPRASSVFAAPLRPVLGSASSDEAWGRSIAACGKSVSRQAFAILPKIESVDRIMSASRCRVGK